MLIFYSPKYLAICYALPRL
uniref:Uncharacterized protein n=1 Tax=Arundo donax TaxID=35708 RepID=A0A0A9AHU4_ARUDO